MTANHRFVAQEHGQFHWRFNEIDSERDRSVYPTCAADEATAVRILMVIADAEQDATVRTIDQQSGRALRLYARGAIYI